MVKPTPGQVEWQDMELGLFIHYDLLIFEPGWDHRQYENRPGPEIFNPKKLDQTKGQSVDTSQS